MIYLIVGRTASGKDYVANKLVEAGLSKVISYATRPKRTPDENTHIFITPEEANSYTDKVARTVISEYEYFATKEQVDAADIYIIDPIGLKMLTDNMPDEAFHVIYVQADDDERRIHAVKRAENKIKEEKIFEARCADENEQFDAFEDDLKHLRDDFRFNANVTAIDVFHNEYDKEITDKYIQYYLDQKKLHDTMVKIVTECANMNIVKYTDDHTKLIVVNKNNTERYVSIEQFADIVLGNPHGMQSLMHQYIINSSMFNQPKYILQYVGEDHKITNRKFANEEDAYLTMKKEYDELWNKGEAYANDCLFENKRAVYQSYTDRIPHIWNIYELD